jgi:hypothetical protein
MKSIKWRNFLLPFVLVVFIIAGTANNILAHGGGGGGGGGGGDKMDNFSDAQLEFLSTLSDEEILSLFSTMNVKGSLQTTKHVSSLSQEELENLYSILPPKQRNELVWTGDMTVKELQMQILMLSGVAAMDAAYAAAMWTMLTDLVVMVDYAGQGAQFTLAFVPGVGWVTQAILGGARAGAEANKVGSSDKDIEAGIGELSGEEILEAALVAMVGSSVIANLSPLELDDVYALARSSNTLTEALPYIAAYLAGKQAESYAESQLTGAGAPNRVRRYTKDTNRTSMGTEQDPNVPGRVLSY